VTIILARCWIIFRLLKWIILFLFCNAMLGSCLFCKRIHWIVKSRRWIRVWFELKFATEVHFLWNITKLFVWLVLSSVRHIRYMRPTPPIVALSIRCRLWPHLTVCSFWIVVPWWWIGVCLPLILTSNCHFLWYISKLLVGIVSTSFGILIHYRASLAIFDVCLICLRVHMAHSRIWIVLAWSGIFIWIEFILVSKIDFVEIAAKRFLKIMSTWTKVGLLLLLPYLSHFSETDHPHRFASFRLL
jgi:hypothetical protein